MAKIQVGDILKKQREKLGYTLDHVSKMTNIRVQVLQTFEENDYIHFPPDGYARGMLSSYARFLNLDANEVLSAYDSQKERLEQRRGAELKPLTDVDKMKRRALEVNQRAAEAEEQHESERHSASPHETSSIKIVPRSSSVRRSGRVGTYSSARRASSAYVSSRYNNADERQNAPIHHRFSVAENIDDFSEENKTEYTDIEAFSAATSGRLNYHRARTAASSLHRKSKSSDTSFATGRLTDIVADISEFDAEPSSGDASQDQSADEAIHTYELREHDYDKKPTARGKRTNKKSSSNHHAEALAESPFRRLINAIVSIFSDKRTRLIAIAVFLFVVAIAIAASILISSATNDKSGEVINVEGGAAGDSTTQTNTDGQGNTTATVTTVNGNPVVITLEVESGKTSLINVTYDDDAAYNGTAVGPWTREFRVTKSFYASFGTPDAVKVTENGKEIQITGNSDGTGSLTVNIQAAGLAESSK